jgi:mRNA-degrading endonuclease RelE of RelBE toxin-antitoxin system
MTYRDEYHPRIKKDLKKLSPNLRKAIITEHIPAILSNPEKGEPLAGNLGGILSYHLKFIRQEYGFLILRSTIKNLGKNMGTEN